MLTTFISKRALMILAAGLVLTPGIIRADIIPASRRAAWQSNVGVEGGIPGRATVFRTLVSTNTAADINGAIAACPSNQVVQLMDGTYYLTGPILIGHDGVTLRGQGSNTVLRFIGTISGNGYVVFSGPNQNNIWAGVNQGVLAGSANWTNGFAAGSTSISLSSVAGLTVGSVICLDQLNDNIDVSSQGVDGFCNYCGRGGIRSQQQWVRVGAINGNTVTISPPLAMPNWNTNLSPQAWWVPGFIYNSGVESLNIDGSQASLNGGLYLANVWFNGTWNCWMTNVWSEMGMIAHVTPYGGGHLTIQHCWFAGSRSAGSLSYGIYSLYVSGIAVENNIFNGVDAPLIPSTGVSASVFSYNYVTNVLFNADPPWMDASVLTHGAGNCMNLYEGDYINQWDKDLFHGSSAYETLFRSRVTGTQVGKTENLIPVIIWATNHYMNVVGNVLGTAGVQHSYAGFVGGPYLDPAIYNVGFGRVGDAGTALDDNATLATVYLHGNYDVVNQSIIWSSTNSDHNLPTSLYLVKKPSWFGDRPWPPFDPAAPAVAAVTNLPAGYRFLFGIDPPPANLGTRPPVAVVSATPLTGPAPVTVSFSSAGSYAPPGVALSSYWSFGDGSVSTAANPTHTFQAAGVYRAQLTVSDGLNTAQSRSLSITVTNGP